MAVIRKDEYGLFAKVGGHIARPIKPTQFTEGSNVAGKHFGGSPVVGMGKMPGRGEYAEYWKTWDLGNLQYDPWVKYY